VIFVKSGPRACFASTCFCASLQFWRNNPPQRLIPLHHPFRGNDVEMSQRLARHGSTGFLVVTRCKVRCSVRAPDVSVSPRPVKRLEITDRFLDGVKRCNPLMTAADALLHSKEPIVELLFARDSDEGARALCEFVTLQLPIRVKSISARPHDFADTTGDADGGAVFVQVDARDSRWDGPTLCVSQGCPDINFV